MCTVDFFSTFSFPTVWLQGFELEFDPVVARLFSACQDSDKLDHAVRSLVERYLSVEDLFAGKANEDGVIADLIKAHKDDPEVCAAGTAADFFSRRSKFQRYIVVHRFFDLPCCPFFFVLCYLKCLSCAIF